MTHLLRLSPFVPTILLSLALAACGGSDSSRQTATSTDSAKNSQQLAQEASAPQVSGNMATDGLNWFNFRRQQMGMPKLARNSLIDTASQGHSEYQKRNNIITHDQTSGKDGFTGVDLQARLSKANYNLVPRYAIGEVIAKTGYTYGFTAAEALITAIYHRFVIFEPMYKEAGAGYATADSAYTYFTTDLVANNGLGDGLGVGNFAVYPVDGQKNLPNNFFSDSEEPDPVPNQNEVGYPISIHADITRKITVQNFTIQSRGGTPLSVLLLKSTSDTNTPSSAASIIPLAPLAANTTYDVAFSGGICSLNDQGICSSANTAISKNWSFTTK
ncbi:MAG: CAP domain-containing protein [bacterium]